MKRGVVIILVLVLVATVAGGWWWARRSPEQAVHFLVSGGLEAGRAEEFVAAIGGPAQVQEEEGLLASGTIEGEEIAIVAEFGGQIVRIHAEEGNAVEAGTVLVELDTSLLQAQLAQAEAGVQAATANLENVRAGTHPAEILAAEASLRKAEAEMHASQAVWEDLQLLLGNPQDLDAQIAQAKAAIEVADAGIEQAKAQIAQAEDERFQYHGQGSLEEKYLFRVHDYLVKAAQAALEGAQSEKEGAEATLAALVAIREHPLPLLSQVHQAEGRYRIAEAGVAVARANLAELSAGPTLEEVGVAAARVEQVRAAVSGLQRHMDKMRLSAPISGVVSSRSANAGETALPGATLLTIANLDEVELTVYIPEDKLGRVYLGQEVDVYVDSFPSRAFSGTVSYISQQAEFTPKNVQTEEERVNMVFAVKVRLSNPGHLLKPGMPADAILGRDRGG